MSLHLNFLRQDLSQNLELTASGLRNKHAPAVAGFLCGRGASERRFFCLPSMLLSN